MLARRPYSVAEMRRALRRKFPEDAPVREAISKLQQLHFLDDRKFALQYASFLVRHRAFGPDRVRRELQIKRISPSLIDSALNSAFEENSEEQLLERALDKKLRHLQLPLAPPKVYSLCQSLRRLGFRSDAIMRAVRSRKIMSYEL